MQGIANSALSAATGSLALGVETADTAVQLGRSAVGAAGVAGQAALKTAGQSAQAALEITSAATAAAASVTKNALAATDKISKAALNTGATVAAQGVDTAGKAAVQGLQVAEVTATAVFDTTKNVVGVLNGLINTPLAGFASYFENKKTEATQTKGVKGKDLLVGALVSYYTDKQQGILKEITTLKTERLQLVGEIQKIFSNAHCITKRGWLWNTNTCDQDYTTAERKFKKIESDINSELLEIKSQIIGQTRPLRAELNFALGTESIDPANPTDLAKLTKIFTEKTAPHSAQIAEFFTIMNILCSEATEVFARKKSSAVPPSLPTHRVQMGVTPNLGDPNASLEQRLANLKLPNANMQIPNPNANQNNQPSTLIPVGGRRRTTRTKRHRLRKTRNSRPIRRSKTVHRKQRRTRRS